LQPGADGGGGLLPMQQQSIDAALGKLRGQLAGIGDEAEDQVEVLFECG